MRGQDGGAFKLLAARINKDPKHGEFFKKAAEDYTGANYDELSIQDLIDCINDCGNTKMKGGVNVVKKNGEVILMEDTSFRTKKPGIIATLKYMVQKPELEM